MKGLQVCVVFLSLLIASTYGDVQCRHTSVDLWANCEKIVAEDVEWYPKGKTPCESQCKLIADMKAHKSGSLTLDDMAAFQMWLHPVSNADQLVCEAALTRRQLMEAGVPSDKIIFFATNSIQTYVEEKIYSPTTCTGAPKELQIDDSRVIKDKAKILKTMAHGIKLKIKVPASNPVVYITKSSNRAKRLVNIVFAHGDVKFNGAPLQHDVPVSHGTFHDGYWRFGPAMQITSVDFAAFNAQRDKDRLAMFWVTSCHGAAVLQDTLGAESPANRNLLTISLPFQDVCTVDSLDKLRHYFAEAVLLNQSLKDIKTKYPDKQRTTTGADMKKVVISTTERQPGYDSQMLLLGDRSFYTVPMRDLLFGLA